MAASLGAIMDVATTNDNRVERKGLLPLSLSLGLPPLETTVRCRVAAWATLRVDGQTIGEWRKQPVVVGAEKMPISFLKHAEDQTILALKTVLYAIEQQGCSDRSFTEWGVIAAPNLFGRVSIAQTIQRYQQEGAWGVSPHLIPHQSLHAMSGTISQALKIYGPNFGISGGPNGGPDAFLIAAAMMTDARLPGLWVVLTGYESEWIPAGDGKPTSPPICQSVALALTRGEANVAGLYLTVGRIGNPSHAKELSIALGNEFQLGLFAEELSVSMDLGGDLDIGQYGRWRLADGHCLELESAICPSEGRP
jgi:hypothetical protein